MDLRFTFDRRHLCQASFKPLRLFVAGGEIYLDDFPGQVKCDHAPAQAEQVHVVILNALVGGVTFMDQSRPDSGYFIGCETGPHPTAANRNAALHFPCATANARGITKSG